MVVVELPQQVLVVDRPDKQVTMVQGHNPVAVHKAPAALAHRPVVLLLVQN